MADETKAETSLTPYEAKGHKVWKGAELIADMPTGYEARFLATCMNQAYGAGYRTGMDGTLAALDRGIARMNEALAT